MKTSYPSTTNMKAESWILKAASKLWRDASSPEADSWIPSVCPVFLLPLSFPDIAQWNNIYFFISSLQQSFSAPAERTVGSGEEATLGVGRKGQNFSIGEQRPSCLFCMTLDKFSNTAWPHFPIEIASCPFHWMTTIRMCVVALVLSSGG